MDALEVAKGDGRRMPKGPRELRVLACRLGDACRLLPGAREDATAIGRRALIRLRRGWRGDWSMECWAMCHGRLVGHGR